MCFRPCGIKASGYSTFCPALQFLCISQPGTGFFKKPSENLLRFGQNPMLATLHSHRVLWRALTDHSNTYRQRMRPADIIQQSKIERGDRQPIRLYEWLQKLWRWKLKSNYD